MKKKRKYIKKKNSDILGFFHLCMFWGGNIGIFKVFDWFKVEFGHQNTNNSNFSKIGLGWNYIAYAKD